MSSEKTWRFEPDSDERKAIEKWWNKLADNKGERAELRRCRNTTDVVLTQAFFHFLHALNSFDKKNTERLALVAGVLAHVKTHDTSKRIAEQMATPKTGSNARVSGLRFRRLLKIDDRNELYPALVRTVRLLDGSANIFSLAESTFWWSDQTKKHWAYDYYTTAPQEQ